MRSQIPPQWLALGGVNFHLHPLSPKVRIILSWFQACRHCRTIDSAPLKFVPLSLQTIFGQPLLATNLKKSTERNPCAESARPPNTPPGWLGK